MTSPMVVIGRIPPVGYMESALVRVLPQLELMPPAWSVQLAVFI